MDDMQKYYDAVARGSRRGTYGKLFELSLALLDDYPQISDIIYQILQESHEEDLKTL